jgi:hypothetical protein
MSKSTFTADDWEEIYYALKHQAHNVEMGIYDDYPGEAKLPGSETRRWGAHLRRVMRKIVRLTIQR